MVGRERHGFPARLQRFPIGAFGHVGETECLVTFGQVGGKLDGFATRLEARVEPGLRKAEPERPLAIGVSESRVAQREPGIQFQRLLKMLDGRLVVRFAEAVVKLAALQV